MIEIIQVVVCILPLVFASNIAPMMAIKGSTSHACAACKYQRRKCAPECPLRHYFPAENHLNFLNAHRLFGVSNILKTLKFLNDEHKADAMQSIIYESNIRAKFPVYGCMWVIYQLQGQIHQALDTLHYLKAKIAAYKCETMQEEINLNPPSEIAFSNDYSQNHDQFVVENGPLASSSPNYFVPNDNGNYNMLRSDDRDNEIKPTLHGKQPSYNFIDNKSTVVSQDEFLVQHTTEEVNENKISIVCDIGLLPTGQHDEPNVNERKNQIVSADALQFLVDHETDEADDNSMPMDIIAADDQRSEPTEHCESSMTAGMGSSVLKNRQLRRGNVCMDDLGTADLFFSCNEVGRIRTITNL